MINPITQLLMTQRAELNEALRRYEQRWRKGEISFQEYSRETKQMIKRFHSREVLRETARDIHKDSEPKGLLGLVMKLLKRVF